MNPAIDMNIATCGIQPRLVNRTLDTVYTPNGKGINITRVLRHFGMESAALGFFGGFSGRYIVDTLREEGVRVYDIPVDDITRINIFLNDGQQEYKFVNDGAAVSPQAQAKLLELLESLEDLHFLTINGSLPPGIDESFYDSILEVCARRDVQVVLDISSRRLPQLLRFRPLLLKPNDEEVFQIWGKKLESPDSAGEIMDMIHSQGAQNILLTLGDRGMLFSNGEHIWFCDAPKVTLVSSACAGDASLAAFLSQWLADGDVEQAMKKASATGGNVAESAGLGDLKKVPEYMKHLTVRKVR